jgi:hypothetical protein
MISRVSTGVVKMKRLEKQRKPHWLNNDYLLYGRNELYHVVEVGIGSKIRRHVGDYYL